MKVIEKTPGGERSESLINDAAEIARDCTDGSDVIGYVIVAMYRDGAGRTAGWKPNPQEHKIGSQLWQAWVEKSIDHHFVYGEGVDATYAVLNGDA